MITFVQVQQLSSLHPRSLDVQQQALSRYIFQQYHDPSYPLLWSKSRWYRARLAIFYPIHICQLGRDDDASYATDLHASDAFIQSGNRPLWISNSEDEGNPFVPFARIDKISVTSLPTEYLPACPPQRPHPNLVEGPHMTLLQI